MMIKWVQLTKPGVVILLQITAISAVIVHDLLDTSDISVSRTIESALITLVGGYLTAGGSNAINMWYDKDIDPKMKRTRNRPVPKGEVNPTDALFFGIAISVLGVAWFSKYAGQVAAFWAAFSVIFYVMVYTIWLKRRTVQNIVIGGLAGSTPPLIGWFVASGPKDIDFSGIDFFLASLFDTGSLVPFFMVVLIFIWTPPHFWALALYKSKEYEIAGVPMMPWVRGVERTLAEMKIYSVILFLVSLVGPYLIFSGTISLDYLISQILCTVIAFWYLRSIFMIPKDEIPDENGRLPLAARSFWVSQLYLGLMFLTALAGASGGLGLYLGGTISVAVIVRSELKYSATGNPFS